MSLDKPTKPIAFATLEGLEQRGDQDCRRGSLNSDQARPSSRGSGTNFAPGLSVHEAAEALMEAKIAAADDDPPSEASELKSLQNKQKTGTLPLGNFLPRSVLTFFR